ncbi:hypothetical protein BC629DRAFT_1582702 [Irpex lacteus]|nr:hypothetical protein BC629DRAFT_1582702 [Irpex lacteus]
MDSRHYLHDGRAGSVAEKPPPPQAFVDTPRILYSNWPKKAGGIHAPLGSFTTPPKVVLIGGGLANCVAGLELAKAGADVTLLEVSDRVGGRLESILSPTDGVNYQEMGAMRFPPSEDILYYYARQLGFGFLPKFPDPGVVSTLLSYEGRVKLWAGPSDIPNEFATVSNGWNALVTGGITVTCGGIATNEFLAPDRLGALLQTSYTGDSDTLLEVISGWQKYLTTFGSNTFLEGLKRIFGVEHEWDVPGGTQWSDDDFKRFGKLGVGSGGFGPLYDRGFNAILRLVVNGLETDQQIFAKDDGEGKGLQPTVLLRTAGAIRYSTNDSVTVDQRTAGSAVDSMVTYDYALVGTTSKAAIDHILVNIHPEIDSSVAYALNTAHMCASSKLFIRTKKFWETKSGQEVNRAPRVILSDGVVPQLYMLDYGDPDYGLVLVVYAWEQDSIDLQGFTDGCEFYQHLVRNLHEDLKKSSEWKDWTNNLEPYDDLNFKHWQLDPLHLGAFVISGPSHDWLAKTMFYDHLKLSSDHDASNSSSPTVPTSTPASTSTLTESRASESKPPSSAPTPWFPILLNGDSYGWSGGWAQGALETALNNVSVILKARGQIKEEDFAPTTLLRPNDYKY